MSEASEKGTNGAGSGMGKKVISEAIARQDVDRWLDYKKIGETKREDNQAAIDGIVASVMDGEMVVSDQGHEITHLLRFPVGNQEDIKQLTYKARLSLKERNKKLKGVKLTDTGEYLVALIAALANENKAVIEELDTEDYNTAQNVALFFI